MIMFLYSLGQQWRQQRVARKLRFRAARATACAIASCVARRAPTWNRPRAPQLHVRAQGSTKGRYITTGTQGPTRSRRRGRQQSWLTPVPYLEGAPPNASRCPSCASCHIFSTACKRYFAHLSRGTNGCNVIPRQGISGCKIQNA